MPHAGRGVDELGPHFAFCPGRPNATQLDRVIDRWQRMLSGLDARTRFYFYLLRRPIHFPELPLTGASKVVTLGQRKRREFLTKRVQDVSAYVGWAYDPGLSTVAAGRTGGPWWMAYVKNWMARRRNAHESVYLLSAIEAAGRGLSPDGRCKPGAGR